MCMPQDTSYHNIALQCNVYFQICHFYKFFFRSRDMCHLVYILSVGSQGTEVKRKSYAAVSVQDPFQSLARFAAAWGR